jgi:hypothetical protein
VLAIWRDRDFYLGAPADRPTWTFLATGLARTGVVIEMKFRKGSGEQNGQKQTSGKAAGRKIIARDTFASGD